MLKCLVVFIISLSVLIFIIGCPPIRPEPAEVPKVEAPKVESSKVEPPKPEPPQVELAKVETPKVEPPSIVSFHDKSAGILGGFVDDEGMVDYRTLRRKRLEFKNLLGEFDELDPAKYNSWPKEDKIAFWLNAYNIQLLKVITDNYPVKSTRIHRLFWPPTSIRHIKGIWSDYKFIVMDEEFTLLEVDRRFFREEFDEPRIFFAISHASLSSPPLRNEPYYGRKLYEQLDDQVKRFLSSPLAFRIDRDEQKVYLSAIFQATWYGKEFIGRYGTDKKFKDQQPATRAVLNFITNYVSEQDVSFLETANYSVEYLSYDWRLNE